MKLIVDLLAGAFLSLNTEARAGIPVRLGGVEKLVRVYDLHYTEDYEVDKREYKGRFYIDLGVQFTVFEVLWLPVWVVDGTPACGYADSSTFMDLSEESMGFIAETNSMYPAALTKVPCGDRIGENLCFALSFL